MVVTVCGSGSWGTALAHHLASAGHDVRLWGRDAELLSAIERERKNPRYLPEIQLSPRLRTESRLENALHGSQAVVFAVPTHATRELARTAHRWIGYETIIVSTAKGLEELSQKRMTEVLAEELGNEGRVAAISGPSFALEVAKGLPTAVTMAGKQMKTVEAAANLFHYENIRVYHSTDVVGVELGGAVKNVIALAAGIVDGMALGLNARAAIITRGLAEMKRLIEKAGGTALTVMGLSGLGDLLLTATGDLSRNRRVGVALGKGEGLRTAVSNLGQVAEGVRSAKQVLTLAEQLRVEMPIVFEVARIIDGAVTPQQAVRNLLTRSRKEEI